MPSARGCALAALALLAVTTAPLASAAVDTTLAVLGAPTGVKVELAYIISGRTVDPKPCPFGDNEDAECLPELQTYEDKAEADSVIISWQLDESNPNVTNPSNSGIDLRACYAPVSRSERPWRFDKKVINPADSNQCKKLINDDPLPYKNGNYTWQLPNTTPAAVYNIRVYTVCSSNGDTSSYCAWGQSPGFFETLLWNTTPGWLIALTIPFIAMGPVLLVAWGGGHYVMKGRKGAN